MNWARSLPTEAYEYGERSSGETHGVVLTKKHIVNMILDIAGYRECKDLSNSTFLEPSCGHGAFLLPAIQRFFASLNGRVLKAKDLMPRFLAYDINEEHVSITRCNILKVLIDNGIGLSDAKTLSQTWVQRGDFLLECAYRTFDFIIGNPPYIRIEQLSPMLQSEYRNRYSSLFDRADLYVAFIENGLDLLSDNGILTYICADRWILNKYGSPLRRKITKDFGVCHYIDLHNVSPFESEVIAYPSIFSISTKQSKTVQVAALHSGTPEECATLTEMILHPRCPGNGADIDEYSTWFKGSEPWVLVSPEHLKVLRDLENKYEPLESDGNTKVSIGVASGSDNVYIVERNLDIEADRLVPLVKREDLSSGQIMDANRAIINTFTDGKGTINLDEYPKLRTYFAKNETIIKKRHVAKKKSR
jgi:adenine-specific DNA-methyltransferase